MGHIGEAPIFIVGAPRTGTTWLQRLLLSLPQFCGGQESLFFYLFGPAVRNFDVSGRARAVGLSNYWKEADMVEEIRRLWNRTVSPVVRANPHSKWLVEKTPSHVLFVQEILRVLPQSRFIHMVRDSRAVVSSLLDAGKGWGRQWAPRDIWSAVGMWKSSVEAGLRAREMLSQDTFYQVYYERLKFNPFAELKSILQFIGAEVATPLLEKIILENSFERQKAIGGTPFVRYGEHETSAGAFKEPEGFLRKGSADSWKTDLSLVQQVLVWWKTKDLMLKLGYERNGLSSKTSRRSKDPQSACCTVSTLETPERDGAH